MGVLGLFGGMFTRLDGLRVADLGVLASTFADIGLITLAGCCLSLLAWWLGSRRRPGPSSTDDRLWLYSLLCVLGVAAAGMADGAILVYRVPYFRNDPYFPWMFVLGAGVELAIGAAADIAFYWLCVGVKRTLARV